MSSLFSGLRGIFGLDLLKEPGDAPASSADDSSDDGKQLTALQRSQQPDGRAPSGVTLVPSRDVTVMPYVNCLLQVVKVDQETKAIPQAIQTKTSVLLGLKGTLSS
jgi:hypothetical protein